MASLFDTPHIWKTSPAEGFKDFVQSQEYLELGRRKPAVTQNGERKPYQPIRRGSAQVYISMFNKFSRWIGARGIDLYAVTPKDIEAFLNDRTSDKDGGEKDLNSAIRVRYLRMLERVFEHLKVNPNPARIAAWQVHTTPGAAGRDQPKEYLSNEEIAAFMAALPEAPAKAVSESLKAWKRRRDRAMLAMMIGAGLKVSEVIGLYVENIGAQQADGSMTVTISPGSTGGISRWHETVLRPFAVAEVMKWMAERKEDKFAGNLLFPANRDGKRLDETTIYLLVKNTLIRAGIDARRRGGRTLRNTFAKRELAQGQTIEELGEFLGHHERKSTEKYL